ncbi:MAG TPA: serine protease [Herpetosiphonaceae bacterium]
MQIPVSRQSSMHRLLTLLIIVSALLASVATTSARPRPSDPHAIVSNDGFVPTANLAGVAFDAEGAYAAPTEGTGEVSKAAQRPVNDAHIAPAPQGDQVGIESIIGTDSRYQITNTTVYPYRAIAKITSSIGGCTGWLINANTVATAGHCIYGSGGWATNVVVYPGRNGTSTPYGSCGYTRLYSVSGWTTSRSPEYDYGAIKLNCSIGNTTGYFGYRWSSASLTGQPSYISGYPGDKPSGTQWRSDDSIRITETRRLFYANDTYGGHSGSPVWNNGASCSTCGIAIHAYGVGSNGYNGGTRITEAVFNNLTTWKNS